MAYRKEPEDLAVRLCKHYTDGPNGCMNWTGCIAKNGYGQIGIGSKLDGTERIEYAHRLSASVWLGLDLESELEALHKCDNRRCINPDHLFVGTQADNVEDCYLKGRDRHPRGEEHSKSKLTDTVIREIRNSCANGVPQFRLAERYGMSRGQISQIVLRNAWAHVE